MGCRSQNEEVIENDRGFGAESALERRNSRKVDGFC